MIAVARTRMDALRLSPHQRPSLNAISYFISLKPCYRSIYCTTCCGLNEMSRSIVLFYLSMFRSPWPAMSFFQCGVVAVFLHFYNTAMNCIRTLALAHHPIASDLWGNDTIPLIVLGSEQELSGLLRVATSHHVLKREEYGYQWRDIHDAGKFPFTPRCRWW